MIVKPIVVGVVDKAGIEGNLFRRSNIVELWRVFETPQVVFIVDTRHRGEQRAADDATCTKKCGGGTLGVSASVLGDPAVRVGLGHATRSFDPQAMRVKRVLFPGEAFY